MTEVKQMYKIVRYVNSNDNHKDRKKITDVNEARAECIKRYAEKWPWRNKRLVTDWFLNAEKHKFIKIIGSPDDGYIVKIEHGKGMQLVAKKWYFFRVGLREITMKEYPQTQAMFKVKFVAIIGAVATIVGGIAGAVVTYLQSH